jgi:superfamily II DNA or RNA helicase
VPDRIYFITPTGQCHFGIAPLILEWLKKNVNTRTVTYQFTSAYSSKFDVKPWDVVRDDLNLKLRDYQKEAVSRALAQGFGTLVMGTGAGKTLTISSIIHNLFSMNQVKRVMILVPDNGLVVQFHHDLV